MTILLVEDDDVDAMAVERYFSKLGIVGDIDRAHNGLEALDYLATSADKPSCIILDINMPKMNGIEFLKHLRLMDEFRTTPVLILSTSDNSSDIEQCLAHSAAAVFNKTNFSHSDSGYDKYIRRYV